MKKKVKVSILTISFVIIFAGLLTFFIVHTKGKNYNEAKKSVVTVVSGINIEKELLTNDVLVGTGFCYKPGMIITNYHNIKGSELTINVITSDDTIHSAELFAKDEVNDIALLKIDADIPVLNFSKIKYIGQKVKSIATPISIYLRESYAEGIITNQDIVGFGTQRLIQTNINLSPGCSGGPLFDKDFSVVGMITFKSTEFGAEGLSFAISADRLAFLIQRLEKGISTPDLGLTFQKDIYQKYGVPGANGLIIQDVAEGSVVLEKLQVGDLITAINQQDVKNVVEYTEALESWFQEQELTITIIRNGKEQTITVKGG